jgi:nucleotide-binding universal stress UspA family protein
VAGTQAGLTVVTEVVGGNPHEAILDYVADRGIDVVVMGTHGRTGLDRAVMGSVAERVVRRSPAPVLTVRGGGSG